ncbi:substrate-binding domain-containing protein [Vibrio albus]|uniref:substrate-binding domain-containing protein n=1 Tax=Vibrio albus TaxID=2200953 RepID=UPI0015E856B4|nr:substrate-binding domain-containing protein [Vibrio albus]
MLGRVIALILFSTVVQAEDCFNLVVAGHEHRTFWTDIINGAKKASKELNIDIHYRGITRDSDERHQQYAINYLFHHYQCRGLIVAPAGVSINEEVKALSKKGIPTIYIDKDIGGDRLSGIESDNYNAGVMAAKELATALHGKGNNVALFRVKKGISSTDEREQGFIQEAKKLGLNIVTDEYLGVTTGDARDQALSIFRADPNIQGIFTPNDTTTIAVIKTLDQLDLSVRPIHIGFDGSYYMKRMIGSKQLYGFIKQESYEMGYNAVYLLQKAVVGEIPESHMSVPVSFISEENF